MTEFFISNAKILETKYSQPILNYQCYSDQSLNYKFQIIKLIFVLFVFTFALKNNFQIHKSTFTLPFFRDFFDISVPTLSIY